MRLLPDPAHPGLLAEVDLVSPVARPVPADDADLYGAIRSRHTSRTPFANQPLPAGIRAELTEAARSERALLHWPDDRGVRRLLAITREAELRNTCDPARIEESRFWIRSSGDTDYGIPPEALGPRDARRAVPSRDLLAQHPPGRRPERPFEERPHLAVIATAHDRRVDWLRAGQAMQRILLLATRAGLSSSMLHQAVEWPDLRRMLREAGQAVRRFPAGQHHRELPLRPPGHCLNPSFPQNEGAGATGSPLDPYATACPEPSPSPIGCPAVQMP